MTQVVEKERYAIENGALPCTVISKKIVAMKSEKKEGIETTCCSLTNSTYYSLQCTLHTGKKRHINKPSLQVLRHQLQIQESDMEMGSKYRRKVNKTQQISKKKTTSS